jgi:hypothetical protein
VNVIAAAATNVSDKVVINPTSPFAVTADVVVPVCVTFTSILLVSFLLKWNGTLPVSGFYGTYL